MRITIVAFLILALASTAFAAVPYQVERTVAVGGVGGYDYVYADQSNRKLYVPRMGNQGRITVYDLETLAPLGVIDGINGHGVAVSVQSGHGFASSNPVAMWDASSLRLIKTINVEGRPDGILYEPFSNEIWVFSHKAPNLTVIDASKGTVTGSYNLGGDPEQAVTDGKGKVFVDLENKAAVAVVDVKTHGVINRLSVENYGTACAGLALDQKNGILFVACRRPDVVVVLKASDGKFLATVPIGTGCDGALYNPATNEAFTSQKDGSLTVIKEESPTSFVVEQTLKTEPNARTSTLDQETGAIFTIAADFLKGHRGAMIPNTFKILKIGR